MIIFNLYGLILLLIGVGLGSLAQHLIDPGTTLGRPHEQWSTLVMGIFWLGGDLALRNHVRHVQPPLRWWLVHPHGGGHAFWIAFWLWGLLFTGLGISEMLHQTA